MESGTESGSVQKLVGDRLRHRREFLGWSQQDMADRLDIDQSGVSRLERGSARMDMTLACEAADLLGLRRCYLYARDFSESFHTLLGLVWEDAVSPDDEYPMQQAMQLAREELHVLIPDVLGISLFVETDPAPVFHYWTVNQFRFASGIWDTRDDSPRRIGQAEAALPLIDAWRERRVLERERPDFLPSNERFPYYPEYVIDHPLDHGLFGVGFQHRPAEPVHHWVRTLGRVLEVGAVKYLGRGEA